MHFLQIDDDIRRQTLQPDKNFRAVLIPLAFIEKVLKQITTNKVRYEESHRLFQW